MTEKDDLDLRPLPKDWAEKTKGLGKELWREHGGVDFIRAERESWGQDEPSPEDTPRSREIP